MKPERKNTKTKVKTPKEETLFTIRSEEEANAFTSLLIDVKDQFDCETYEKVDLKITRKGKTLTAKGTLLTEVEFVRTIE